MATISIKIDGAPGALVHPPRSGSIIGIRSRRSLAGLAAVLVLTLMSSATWARGGGGGGGGGGHGGGGFGGAEHGGGFGGGEHGGGGFGGGDHGEGHFGVGMEGGHFADRAPGESRGFDGGEVPRVDHDHDREGSWFLYSPYFDDGYDGPGNRYGGYCDLHTPVYNPAYCDY